MADRASLTLALTARYEIEREVGAGGMATVYLARDVRHARQVALKVLHPELAAALGPERFLAEIRTTANLQHPHILALHDSGEADGFLYYVMPFVAGESLRHRLERETQLPIDDAIRIAREMLSALDYAHRHGVVHRDIKPENILLHDGAALVADFGIALAVQSAGGQRMTQTGLSLGTPQYMSPEQAMGEKNIDGRADIYAAGAVLYEMLTGEPPFTGASVQAIVAKVMTERPMSPRTVRETVPEHIEAAVVRALAKLPADRFATAKDFADALEGRGYTGARTGDVARASRPLVAGRVIPWVVAGMLGAVGGAGAVLAARAGRATSPESVRFTVEPPFGTTIFDGTSRHFRLARDGRSVLFAAGAKGSLYLRQLDELQPKAVAGIENVFDFDFSPDRQSLAYVPVDPTLRLKKIRLGEQQETAAEILVAEKAPQQFLWSRTNDIAYINPQGLWVVSAAGGAPRQIVARDTQDGIWNGLTLIDNDRIVAFRVQERGLGGMVGGQLRLVPLSGGPMVRADLELLNAIAYKDGYLLYGSKEGRIMGVRFDLAAGKVRGTPVSLVDNVAVRSTRGLSASVADNGTLAYVTGGSTSKVDIVTDRGATLETLPLESRKFMLINWSPDGTKLLLQSGPVGSADLWVYDTLTRVTTRLTNLNGRVQLGKWTPDGKGVSFLMPGKMNGGNVLAWMPADGSAPPEPVAAAKVASGYNWTPDGKYVLLYTALPGMKYNTPVTAFPTAGGEPIPLLPGIKFPDLPMVSPNGKWMAYSSTESERREVYVRPFPSGAGRLQISTDGGDAPWWSRDGRQVYWRSRGAFHKATLDLSGATARLIKDDSLFADVYRKDYTIHPDDRRFALLRDAGEGAKLVVVTHWLDEALARLKGK